MIFDEQALTLNTGDWQLRIGYKDSSKYGWYKLYGGICKNDDRMYEKTLAIHKYLQGKFLSRNLDQFEPDQIKRDINQLFIRPERLEIYYQIEQNEVWATFCVHILYRTADKPGIGKKIPVITFNYMSTDKDQINLMTVLGNALANAWGRLNVKCTVTPMWYNYLNHTRI